MIIINNTYFKNEIYIPNAKPTVTQGVITVENNLNDFVDKYVKDCLIKCLGYDLFINFYSQLSYNNPNGLNEGADEKWDDLLNGKSYVDSNGLNVRWEGVRFKNDLIGDKPDMSFLAYYVYFYYERNAYTGTAGVGHYKGKAKNAVVVSPNEKTTYAWNQFIEIVQEKIFVPTIIDTSKGIGIDYYGMSSIKTLYGFINDMNNIDAETYPNFQPTRWESINQFGI